MPGPARVLSAMGVVALLLGLVAGVVNRQVVDGGRFAEHADAVRSDPDVARELGGLITDRLLASEPDLTGLRPLIESASATLVASPALGPVVRATVAPLHRALATGDDSEVVLRLADVGALLVAALTTLAPDTTAAIPADLDVRLAELGGHEYSNRLIELTHLVVVLSWALPLAGLLLLAAAGAWSTREVRGTARVLGGGVLAAAAAMAVVLLVTAVVVERLPNNSLPDVLVSAVWDELDESFWRAAALAALAGFLLLVVGSPGFELSPRALGAQIADWVTTRPAAPGPRLVRALVMVLIGCLLVVRPLPTVSMVVVALGVLVVVGGGRDVAAVAATAARTRWRRVGAIRIGVGAGVVGAVAVVGLLTVVAAGALPTADSLPRAAPQSATGGPCNGHRELCGRSYDDVAFPATHNSMSAATEPGWFLAEQPDGIVQQLDHGVRVFLIDSWPGQRTQRPGVVANSEASRQTALDEAERTYGPELLGSALRLRDALDLTPRGEVEPYLCHALCELGSTEWEPLMEQVRAWLDVHPREVVTFFVQDEVTPSDTAQVVEDAGLLPYVHTQDPADAWPTLGEMIASGQRVVFLMENTSGGSAHPWLMDGFAATQDTPYDFTAPDQFTCRLFRGRPDSPLFLVNHWLNNVRTRVTSAEAVNARDVLLPRVRQCQTERGLLPNFVAVDYYDRGDLFDVVDDLNGLS